MQRQFFITATDTDAGKTYFACALTHAFASKGYKTAVYKPISAGCERQVDELGNEQLVNEDALLLQQVANCQQALTQINPIKFAPAIAPHIAAKKIQQTISLTEIAQGYNTIVQLQSDVVICEGAGGWRLPLGNGLFLSDFVKQTKQQVILVVNIKLGCLNHALLTYESIKNDGLNCIAWVANSPDADHNSQPNIDDNITELCEMLPVPLLAKLPYQKDINSSAQQIDLSLLL